MQVQFTGVESEILALMEELRHNQEFPASIRVPPHEVSGEFTRTKYRSEPIVEVLIAFTAQLSATVVWDYIQKLMEKRHTIKAKQKPSEKRPATKVKGLRKPRGS